MQRVQSIQVLRGVAAAGVVLLHCVTAWEGASRHNVGNWAHVSAIGVDLFFVISGFIMANLAASADGPAEFVWRRFVRVAPLYYALSLPWFVMRALAHPADLWDQTLATLAFWPVAHGHIASTLLPVGWTLCFEAVFYLAVGLMIWGGMRVAVTLGALWLAATALNLHGWTGWPQFLGSPMFLEFGLGALIARWRPEPDPRKGLAAIGGAVVLLAVWVLAGIGPVHDGSLVYRPEIGLGRVLVFGPVAALTVWGALALEPWFDGKVVSVLAYLGDASYSTYLIHLLVLVIAVEVWRLVGWPVIILPFVIFAGGHVVGVEVHRLIERPLLRLLRRPKAVFAPAE